MKYDVTLLSTEGWKKYSVSTDRSFEDVGQYFESPYTKKIHVEETEKLYGYPPLEETVQEHPTYKIPSDKALNYFKTTKHDYIDAECMMIKQEWQKEKRQKERTKEQVKKGIERIFR
jgi:hypothetical protein